MSTLARLQQLGEMVPQYVRLRALHPLVPARQVVAYLKHDEGSKFEEFICPGHEWSCSGTAYGGDDESYHGEGRCYCSICGADGDA